MSEQTRTVLVYFKNGLTASLQTNIKAEMVDGGRKLLDVIPEVKLYNMDEIIFIQVVKESESSE